MRDIVLFSVLLLCAIGVAPVWSFTAGWGLVPFAIATSIFFNITVLALVQRLRTQPVPRLMEKV